MNEADVVWTIGPHDRRTSCHRCGHGRRTWLRLVADLYQLARVFFLIDVRANDKSDGLPDADDAITHQCRKRRAEPTIPHDIWGNADAGNITEAVGRVVVARQHRNYARSAAGPIDFDRQDA